MEKENSLYLMEIFIRESLPVIKLMVRVFYNKRMGMFIREDEWIMYNMA